MACDSATAATSPLATEQEQLKAIMASLPPTTAQDPTSVSQAKADAHNASILAVRGLSTTATGNVLFDLADLALKNYEIPTTPQPIDPDFTPTSDPVAADATTTSEVVGEALPVVTTFEPFYFFFYGSLQLASVLGGVCEIEDKDSITLRTNASLDGWKMKMWGPYPALVPATASDEDSHIDGTVWLCEKPEHVPKLCMYETCAYRMAYCDVSVPSTQGPHLEVIKNARTFVNNQELDELEDGRFDVEQYRKEVLRFW